MVNPRVLRIQGRSATVHNIVVCFFRRPVCLILVPSGGLYPPESGRVWSVVRGISSYAALDFYGFWAEFFYTQGCSLQQLKYV